MVKMVAMTSDAGGEQLAETGVAVPGRFRARAGSEVATLAGFCAYLFFFGLGSFGLVGADEPRYAQIAREMLARHDWITPTLNGVPWLEKPALYYWSAILSYKIFGISDWAARVPSAVFATAMVAVIYGFMRRFRDSALDSALIAASLAAVIGFGRAASTDMPLAATMTIGLLAWFAWWETRRTLWLAGFYAMIALGTLAKGPVAPVLAGATIVLFAFACSGSATGERAAGFRLLAKTLWIPGVLLFFAIALPWYFAVQRTTHQFFRVFILQHNLERFGTNLYRHQQPYWYYLPVFLLGVLPWTVCVIAAIVAALRELRRGANRDLVIPSTARDPGFHFIGRERAWRIFLLLWIAAPLAVFTISQSKLPGYILPSIPPCALLVADWLRARSQERASSWLLAAHSLICGMLLGGTLLAPYFIVRTHPPALAITIAGIAAAVIALAMLLTLRWQGLCVLRFVTLVPVVLGLAFVLRLSAPLIDRTQSARPVAEELSRLGVGGAQVAAFNITRETEYGLDFYRNQPVKRYERGEAPAADHLLIARSGSEPQLDTFLPDRRLSHVGSVAAQKLEIYWVSAGTPHHHHE
jgi:4-amino-4-deoxy-L-arabinose transferase-like glycosyltransferase